MNKSTASTLILFLSIITLSFSNCKQPDNPKYFGKEYGKFDLAKLTFNENMDTLFSKIDHVKIPRHTNADAIYIYRADTYNLLDELYTFYGLNLKKTKYIVDKKGILVINDFTYLSSKDADVFFKKVRDSQVYKEINVKESEVGNKRFLGKNEHSLLEITKILKDSTLPEGECTIVINLFRYPQEWNNVKGNVL